VNRRHDLVEDCREGWGNEFTAVALHAIAGEGDRRALSFPIRHDLASGADAGFVEGDDVTVEEERLREDLASSPVDAGNECAAHA